MHAKEMHYLGVGVDPCIHIILSKAVGDLSRSIKAVLSILEDVNSHTCCAKLFGEGNTGGTSYSVGNGVGGTL
jgi:hypothetical protein